MSKVHERVLEVTFTTANGAQTLTVSALKYYRDRGQLLAGTGFSLTFSPSTAQALASGVPEIALGELTPPPTHLRFNVTISA